MYFLPNLAWLVWIIMYSNHGNHRWSLHTLQPILTEIKKRSWTFQGELDVFYQSLFLNCRQHTGLVGQWKTWKKKDKRKKKNSSIYWLWFRKNHLTSFSSLLVWMKKASHVKEGKGWKWQRFQGLWGAPQIWINTVFFYNLLSCGRPINKQVVCDAADFSAYSIANWTRVDRIKCFGVSRSRLSLIICFQVWRLRRSSFWVSETCRLSDGCISCRGSGSIWGAWTCP